MDRLELLERIEGFDAAVAEDGYPKPAPGEWSAALILAHAAAVNRLVADAVAAVIDGDVVPYTNRPAGRTALLRAIVRETGEVSDLKADVIRTAHVLVDLADELGAAAGVPIPTFIGEGDIVHVDGPVPALALIGSVLGFHLGVHAEQLAAQWGRGAADTPGTAAAGAAA